MLSWIREKFGPVVIGGIISCIALVFVFYGVFSPKSTRGLHEGSVAGTVNGDPISIGDFKQALDRRMEFFKNLGGGKLTDEQLKSFRIREGVFQELANQKMMIQEAQRLGLLASDEEVKERIREIPVFQKDGKFDLPTYKNILEINHQTPGSYERLVQEGLSLQQWEKYFQDRVHVVDRELKSEFTLNEDKRNIKYVLITPEVAKKSVEVKSDEIQKYLKDEAHLNLVKMNYEGSKTTRFKGKSFDAVKEDIVHDTLAGEKIDQIDKMNQKLADQVIGMMTTSKSSDSHLNSFLKPYGIEVKSTGWVKRENRYIQGFGEPTDLFADAFAEKSPLDPQQGGKPKKYSLGGRIIVAVVTESQRPDLMKFESQREALFRQIASKKAQALYQSWMQSLTDRGKVEANPAVVSVDTL